MASPPDLVSTLKSPAKLQVHPKVQISRKTPKLNIVLTFHTLAIAWYLRVWLWHFTPQAAQLPGAKGFGWFTRYLTFYSFSLQLLQLFLCCFSALLKESKAQNIVKIWADDLSCALFGLANAVTIMFYFLEATTKDMVEGGQIERPPWLGFAVHMSNSITAWLDLLIAPRRSFSKRSSQLSLVLVAAYTFWILISSHFNGAFPYPFLNKLPWPQGFIGVTLAGQLLFFLLFKLGKQLRKFLQRAKAQILSDV